MSCAASSIRTTSKSRSMGSASSCTRSAGPADQPEPGEISKESGDAIDARLQVRVPVKAGSRSVGAAFIQRRGRQHDPAAALPSKLGRSVRRDRQAARQHPDHRRPVQSRRVPATPRAVSASSSAVRRRPVPNVVAPNRSSPRSPAVRIGVRPPTDDLTPLMAFYEDGRRRTVHSKRASNGRCIGSSPAPSSCCGSNAQPARDRRRGGRTGSATSNWRRVSRSSSGARSRTTSCWVSPSMADLTNPATLDAQVRRMLADSRSRALVQGSPASGCSCAICAPWCPDCETFPDFDDQLREAFGRETELLFESIVRRGSERLDLLRATTPS